MNMPTDIDSIVRDNPQVSTDYLMRVDALLKRLDRLGIRKTEYGLETPFSLSLRQAIERNRAASRLD